MKKGYITDFKVSHTEGGEPHDVVTWPSNDDEAIISEEKLPSLEIEPVTGKPVKVQMTVGVYLAVSPGEKSYFTNL